MSYTKHIKSPFQKTEEEAKSLTQDEYLQLEVLFKRFKESKDKDSKVQIIFEINPFIWKFSAESKVVFYYENWAKQTIQSDSYMSLILNLQRLSELVYEGSYFRIL